MIWIVPASVLLIAGIVGLFLARQWRRGQLRNAQRWHANQELPFFIRNLGYAMLPFGLACLLLFALFLIARMDGLWTEYVRLGLCVLAVVAFVFGDRFHDATPQALRPERGHRVRTAAICRTSTSSSIEWQCANARR